MILYAWAQKWGVSLAAIHDLQSQLGSVQPVITEHSGADEASVQSRVRVAEGRKGALLFRNNVGALPDARGVPVRYGLANDSSALNKVVKSGDLIGIRPIWIEPHHVGQVIGQFVSRECKAEGWQYGNTPREQAQQAWIDLIVAKGGDATFTTGSEIL